MHTNTPILSTKKLLLVLGLALFFAHCRAEQNGTMSEVLDTESDEVWYDMDGAGDTCATPPATCPAFDYEKEFVDACVEKGGRSKTCGCSTRCTVKLDYTRITPKPETAAEQDIKNSDPAAVCSQSELSTLSDIIGKRRAGGDEDRCIEDFLCQGTTERCQPEAIEGVVKIRNIARNGCSRETLNAFCRNGFSDSLQCPDNNIKELTGVLAQLADKSNPARRCTRNVLCFESETSCDAGQKAEAQKYRRLLNKDGCEYWLRKLCALD